MIDATRAAATCEAAMAAASIDAAYVAVDYDNVDELLDGS